MAAPVIYSMYLTVVHVPCSVLLHTFEVLQAGMQVASSDNTCVQSACLLTLKGLF